MPPRTALRRAVLPLTAPVGSVRSAVTSEPAVVLTYDDGPDPDGTPAVLDALDRHGATATFFVLVGRAERQPSLLAELVARGHDVGLHGVDHTRLTGLPVRQVVRRIRDGRRRLEDLLGRRVCWFRPPYGAQSAATWAATRACGLVPVVWGVAAYDWLDQPEDLLAARAAADLSPGAILLLHDGFAGPGDGVDDGPAPSLDRGLLADLLLADLGGRGLVARSLADVAGSGRLVRAAWFRP